MAKTATKKKSKLKVSINGIIVSENAEVITMLYYQIEGLTSQINKLKKEVNDNYAESHQLVNEISKQFKKIIDYISTPCYKRNRRDLYDKPTNKNCTPDC